MAESWTGKATLTEAGLLKLYKHWFIGLRLKSRNYANDIYFSRDRWAKHEITNNFDSIAFLDQVKVN